MQRKQHIHIFPIELMATESIHWLALSQCLIQYMKISRTALKRLFFRKRDEFDRVYERIDHIVIKLFGDDHALRFSFLRKSNA